MPTLRSTLPLALTLAAAPFARGNEGELQDDITAQVKAARAILDPWHAASPQPADRLLHVVCWTPSDRDPPADYIPRLTRILGHIQQFYAREMERLGFGPRSINLAHRPDGNLVIHLVKGANPYADYDGGDGQRIRTECLPTLKAAGIDPDRETLVIFCNMADWDPEKKTFSHRSPYYAGGSSRSGTAWQLDSPELDTTNLALTEPLIQDGQYGRISLGKHNSIFIGGIAHEIGHALGLPHNRERPDERAAFGTALMGSGNRSYGEELRGESKGSFLTLAHGLRLASHPQFSGSVKGLNRPVRSRFSDFSITQGDSSFSISGLVDSDTPVYALVGYLDPDGGSDYDATTVTAIPDQDGRFSLNCLPLVPDKNAALNLVACHVNGATSRHSLRYSVGGDGRPDLSAARTRIALEPLIAAIDGDGSSLETALDFLHQHAPDDPRDLPLKIARRLIASRDPARILPAPADVSPDAASVPLGDTTASAAKVGWHRPFIDRTPPPSTLLGSGGRLFEHGIYAHAPAQHQFSLGKKWGTLAGSCGLADGSTGSVVFVISGDGKVIWRSPLTKPGSVHRFEVSVEGTAELSLSVEDGGDGNGSDWGLWLEPTLTR